MAESKYGKYILREPYRDAEATMVKLSGDKDFGGIPFSLAYHSYSEPDFPEKEPMAHDFDQFLFFLSGNPKNLREFGAEIDLSLGQECEQHLIDSPSIVHIPRGLVHGPLNYRKVDKTFVLINLYFTPTYSKTVISQ